MTVLPTMVMKPKFEQRINSTPDVFGSSFQCILFYVAAYLHSAFVLLLSVLTMFHQHHDIYFSRFGTVAQFINLWHCIAGQRTCVYVSSSIHCKYSRCELFLFPDAQRDAVI
uniref:Uncharacterized protein n=1 Tax=Rhipicephalus zambeziensis TaxID=60191 RepID=A0A224YFZ0_9ACAR